MLPEYRENVPTLAGCFNVNHSRAIGLPATRWRSTHNAAAI